VRAALAAQLGAAALGNVATAAASGGVWASLGPLKTALLFVTAIGGGGAAVGLFVRASDAPRAVAPARSTRTPTIANREVQAPRSPSPDRPPIAPASAVPAERSSTRPVTTPSARVNAAQPNRLADEIRLLKRADQALRQGRPELARSLLDDLSTRYPQGQLLEERAATETLLACQHSRNADALATAREFLAAHPGSVYAPRIRAACIDFSDGE